MRSLARLGTLPLLAAPVSSWALGLGEIETNSYLNQPLRAEIPLTATAEELQSLRVSLAPPAEFRAAGLDYPAVLNSIQFTIGRNEAGESVILITSRESVGEVFLTMMVQATHNRGGFSRQYTLLLDPPLFLPAEAPREPISAPTTRETAPAAGGGNIVREQPVPAPRAQPAPQQAAPSQAQPQPQPQPPQPQQQTQRQPAPVDPAGYTVQSGDTLWNIAERYRPADVSTNQAMIAIFEANAAAFDGNINRMRRGAILRIPAASALGGTASTAANAEVRRQIDEWQAGAGSSPRLTLIAPGEQLAANNAAAAGAASGGAQESARVAELEAELREAQAERDTARAAAAEAERLLQVQSAELANLQAGAAAESVDEEQVFAEETPAPEAAAEAEAAEEPAEEVVAAEETPAEEPAAAAARTTAAASAADEPSIVDRILDTVTKPIVWGAALGVLVLVGLLAFLRRRRENFEDVTGQWEAFEAETDGEADHAATTRMRALAEPDMVVVEGHEGEETAEERALSATAEIQRLDAGTAQIDALTLPGAGRTPARRATSTRLDDTGTSQTLSSQTVINLDQADPIAEADFHMAYGLYDQAADLISKALNADPNDRALKLKLLEVYFVWGNKEAFLESAMSLRKDVRSGPDWDKVVIMGKQICPDEPLFAEATASAGEVDLDLASSTSAGGLDFTLEDVDDGVDVNLDVDDGGLALEASGARARRPASEDDVLDIGSETQAGLEAALLEDLDERGQKTTPGDDIGMLDSTLESPTVETRGRRDEDDGFEGITLESPTVEAAFGPDSPTVETPTVESPGFGYGSDTVEQRGPAARRSDAMADMTAEIALDDLGLDIGDLRDMSEEVIDLSDEDGAGDVLSATGVTKVLRNDNALGFTGNDLPAADAAMVRTEVLEQPVGNFNPDLPATEDDLDLNLDDFSTALDGGADTVEQPKASRFGGLDLDIGTDVPGDDEPTGTEEYNPLDPQTMTEVGTKLDLARAYIDMGDPEGAKSILEEVLSEGDAGQRNEAQALIDALPAA